MSYIDIFGIKQDIVEVLRDYLYPRQTITYDFYDATITTKYAQSFIPFSTSINSISIYCNTVGTNLTPMTVGIQEDKNGNPSGIYKKKITFSPTEITNNEWDIKKLGMHNLISKNTYWLVIETTGTSTDYYRIGCDSVVTNYQEGRSKQYITSWNTLSGDLAFKIHTDNWIYPYFPSDTITVDDLPRLAVEVYDRRTTEKYCPDNIVLADIRVMIVGYSQYSDELDKIFSYGERGLFKKRTSIPNVDLLTPEGISPLERIQEKMYSRSTTYSLRKKMKYTSTIPTVH